MPYGYQGQQGQQGRPQGQQQYDPRGKVRLWPNDFKKGPKDPDLTGLYVDDNGNEWQISLWEQKDQPTRDRPRPPVLSGRIRPSQRQQRGQDGNQGGYGRAQYQQPQRQTQRPPPQWARNDRNGFEGDDPGFMNGGPIGPEPPPYE
jgi:hypothetical protein